MKSEERLAGAYTARRIRELSAAGGASASKMTLAQLRRGVGKAPGALPELWGVTLGALPEELLSRDGTPTAGEWAVYTALTLFALHQQGTDITKRCMDKEGVGLGTAVRRLCMNDEEERVKRRFDKAATAADAAELAHHLRGLVQLLRAADIQLDYALLTEDICKYQYESLRDSVRLRWGQDFYRMNREDADDNGEGKDGIQNEE